MTIEKLEQITGRPGPTLAMEMEGRPLPEKKPDRSNMNAAAAMVMSKTQDVAKKMAMLISGLVNYGAHIFFSTINFFRNSQQAASILKLGIISVMLIWLFVFMVGTVMHLFTQSKPVQEVSVEQVLPETPMPFTIQVAAYLKQKHALRYVNLLKEKGIDARMKKIDGGGKSWYLVRVSQFADKQSAYDYGRKLKNEEMIDDFFVNNR